MFLRYSILELPPASVIKHPCGRRRGIERRYWRLTDNHRRRGWWGTRCPPSSIPEAIRPSIVLFLDVKDPGQPVFQVCGVGGPPNGGTDGGEIEIVAIKGQDEELHFSRLTRSAATTAPHRTALPATSELILLLDTRRMPPQADSTTLSTSFVLFTPA